ncbi:MAG: 16S rRNA (guanine(527)-N(7))-methyltransferase RsmG [Synechococcaceae cyanobacterium]|nr:16S rRNA (guanine(527)-N(7))-methyltransferase RsmG [Synechococcaceae cyanobacterium]
MVRPPLHPPAPPSPCGDGDGTAAPVASLWQALGWRPQPAQLDLLIALQDQLRQWNRRVNLTRLVEADDYWISQVFDSLWPLVTLLGPEPAAWERPLRLIDVGTGGGFPGLALAIALPQARITLVDSVGRKLDAVGAMVQALGLQERVTLRCERIERSGHDPDCRGRFDWAVARAVAAAPVVAEYLVPLLAPRGQALLYRGQWGEEDARALAQALPPLRAALEPVLRCDLPGERGVRHALLLRPTAPCPRQFPRAVGVPARQPLGGTAR